MKKNIKIMLILIIMINSISIRVQAQQWLTAGNPLGGGEVLGSTTPYPLNFITSGIQQATILANGNFGIGTPPFSPNYLLDVNGNINIAPANGIYRIGGWNFLKDNGNTLNTFVGFNAGQNTFGPDANTYVGFEAGAFSTSSDNTFIGGLAGGGNPNSSHNCTFFGAGAGYANV